MPLRGDGATGGHVRLSSLSNEKQARKRQHHFAVRELRISRSDSVGVEGEELGALRLPKGIEETSQSRRTDELDNGSGTRQYVMIRRAPDVQTLSRGPQRLVIRTRRR